MAGEHEEELLLDACVVINLLASGIPLPDYSDALHNRFPVAEPASREALVLAAEGAERERIDIAALTAAGTIQIAELHPIELDHYVSFAAQVDDGVASTLAVALHRNFRVATDDRKARRLASEQAPPIKLISTPEILRACEVGPLQPHLPAALRRIEHRANFRPRRDDPLTAWWMDVRDR